MSKPSGKLEFSYRTIAGLEATIDALRQQLADVSNERDGFRAQVEEAERFVEYLINNCGGQLVYEGKIKYWMACSIEQHAKEKSTEQRVQS